MKVLFSGDLHNGVRGELRIITKESLLPVYEQELYESVNYHIISERMLKYGWENTGGFKEVSGF